MMIKHEKLLLSIMIFKQENVGFIQLRSFYIKYLRLCYVCP